MTDQAAVKDKPIEEKVVLGGFQIALNIAGRTITVNGYIQEGETKADLNRRIDEAQDIIDRQMVRNDLQNEEGNLKKHLANLETVHVEYKKLVDRKQKMGKLPTALQNNLDNFDSTVDNIKRAIEFAEKAIQEDKKKLAQL